MTVAAAERSDHAVKPASPGEAAVSKEGCFLGGCLPRQNGVAMGELPEAADDVAMAFRTPGPTQCGSQRDGKVLVRRILGMREWQAEEHAQVRRYMRHMVRCQRQARIMAGERIGRIHVGGAAKGIARDLIGEEDQYEGAFGCADPVVVPACRNRHVKAEKAVKAGLVEGWLLGEPLLFPGVLPERDDIGGMQDRRSRLPDGGFGLRAGRWGRFGHVTACIARETAIKVASLPRAPMMDRPTGAPSTVAPGQVDLRNAGQSALRAEAGDAIAQRIQHRQRQALLRRRKRRGRQAEDRARRQQIGHPAARFLAHQRGPALVGGRDQRAAIRLAGDAEGEARIVASTQGLKVFQASTGCRVRCARAQTERPCGAMTSSRG